MIMWDAVLIRESGIDHGYGFVVSPAFSPGVKIKSRHVWSAHSVPGVATIRKIGITDARGLTASKEMTEQDWSRVQSLWQQNPPLTLYPVHRVAKLLVTQTSQEGGSQPLSWEFFRNGAFAFSLQKALCWMGSTGRCNPATGLKATTEASSTTRTSS